MAARYVCWRKLLSSGKILSEEEKAAENGYIKKTEQEKLEKLARKGPKTDQFAESYGGGSVTDAKPSASSASGASSVERASTDKYRNYEVLEGAITAFGTIGLYIKGTAKKSVRTRLKWIAPGLEHHLSYIFTTVPTLLS